jgi:PEP-CTERM motif
MTDLTWTTYSSTSPAYTFSMGQFSSPVSFVSLVQSSGGIAAFLDAFNSSGQLVDSCLEYQGAGPACVTTVSSDVYKFTFTDASNDISQVVAGAYAPMGPITGIAYSAYPAAPDPVGVPEPSTLALFALGAVLVWAWRSR